MRDLLRTIFGGRPMVRLGFAFTDSVSGRSVHHFRDTFGREWLAEHQWARFRVERATTTDHVLNNCTNIQTTQES